MINVAMWPVVNPVSWLASRTSGRPSDWSALQPQARMLRCTLVKHLNHTPPAKMWIQPNPESNSNL